MENLKFLKHNRVYKGVFILLVLLFWGCNNTQESPRENNQASAQPASISNQNSSQIHEESQILERLIHNFQRTYSREEQLDIISQETFLGFNLLNPETDVRRKLAELAAQGILRPEKGLYYYDFILGNTVLTAELEFVYEPASTFRHLGFMPMDGLNSSVLIDVSLSLLEDKPQLGESLYKHAETLYLSTFLPLKEHYMNQYGQPHYVHKHTTRQGDLEIEDYHHSIVYGWFVEGKLITLVKSLTHVWVNYEIESELYNPLKPQVSIPKEESS